MDQERWENLIAITEEKFGIKDRRTEENFLGEREDGSTIKEEKEIIEFESPMGRIKLERIVKPKVIDKKTLYSKRIGGNIDVEYVYSPDEITCQLKAYKLDDDKNQWVEITYDFR